MESAKGLRLKAEFGQRLRACRIAAGHRTAAELARKLDIELPRYNKYERGDSIPPLDILQDIYRLLGKDPNFLLLGLTSHKAN